VLIGGGVGITPVLSMLNAIAECGSTRETWFFYGVRHGGEHIMRDHLRRLDQEHENIHVRACYSDVRPEDREGDDYDIGERVSVELFKRLLPSNNYAFYICGPPPMMNSLTDGLKQWGVPDERIYFEAFGPASVKPAKPPAAAAAALAPAAVSAKVAFARSGKSFPWSGESKSLLAFAESNGVAMESGCRAGNCGSCLVAVKSGKVRYLQPPGATVEPGSCLTCISVPDGDVTIDA
ncbi:MAG: 2Fe-2S iron-sulfur cluster binding domain-containing protein, partial [Phycisphaerales bacterium]|nr:2Fe-2S iron-sulfur cluster binding domain-containing protein [Phycisphaerales bacterium]